MVNGFEDEILSKSLIAEEKHKFVLNLKMIKFLWLFNLI